MTSQTSSWSFFFVSLTCAFCLLHSGHAAQDGDSCAPDNKVVLLEGETSDCPTAYLRCEHGTYRQSACVNSVINLTTGLCEVAPRHCQVSVQALAARRKRSASSAKLRSVLTGDLNRVKRQTTDPCEISYVCPPGLTLDIVYPNWSDCDQYVVCSNGVLEERSCQPEFTYYNARRLSCETYPSPTNTCVWRSSADLTRVFR